MVGAETRRRGPLTTTAGRDVEELRAGLERWLRTRRHGADLRVAPLTAASAGYSSEIYFVDVATPAGEVDHLVARLPPAGGGLFPRYDLPSQARLQSLLHQRGFPVARVVGVEESSDWTGTPFLLMQNTPGRLVPDDPGGMRRSWLAEAGKKAQRLLYLSFIDTLADLHGLDWDVRRPADEVSVLDFLAGPEGAGEGGPDLGSQVDWWDDYLRWAGPEAIPAELVRGLGWCRANLPSATPVPSLLWGDARLANVVFDESLAPAAVLDWEMASVGPAEVDVGWFLALRALALGGEERVELPGFLGRGETVERYEARLGRALGDLRWYEIFALVRSTAVMARMGSVLGQRAAGSGWRDLMRPALERIRALIEGEGGRG